MWHSAGKEYSVRRYEEGISEMKTGKKESVYQRRLAIYYFAFSEFTRRKVYI
jgi:hypothetical protein